MSAENIEIFIIAEKHDIGIRDTVYRHMVGCESVYGNKLLPYFKKITDAEKFILDNGMEYRDFEILRLMPNVELTRREAR